MKVKNKKTLQIPDWFDLRKYEEGNDSSLIDWALNLIVRRWSNHIHQIPFEFYSDDYELIKKHGFLHRSLIKDTYEEALNGCNLMELKPGLGLVYPLPLWRALDIHDSIQYDSELRNNLALVKYQNIFDHQRTKPLSSGELALKKWYEEHYEAGDFHSEYDSYSPQICVDLGAPDDTIISAFKDWLKATRQNENNEGSELPTKVSSKLISRWKDAAILPYLDLMNYQHIEGGTIPAHVIGDAIFPSTADFDTTEAVRKTARPNANKALMQAEGILRHALIVDALKKSGKEMEY